MSYIDASSQHCVIGFLKNESLPVIVDAPRDSRIYNSFYFIPINIQSMPINESGVLVKFFIAAKFNHTISSGWPLLQIRRRIHTNDSSYFSQVFITTMEPRPTGYLNVFEYDVQNMGFDVQHIDSIRVFWPLNTDVSRRYSLAYFRDNSNVMLSIEIDKNVSTIVTIDDSISTEIQYHTETVTADGDNRDLIIRTSSDTLENLTFSMIITGITDTPMISGKTDAPNGTTITSSTNNTTTIIIGSVVCTILALMLLSIAMVIIVFTYRHHKNKTAPYATQQLQASKDSNQADTTRGEAKHDEAVDCIEMDSNQAYITHGETKGEQGAGKKEMGANQAYGTDVLPTDPNVAYGTVDCIEMDANQTYGSNTVPTDPNVAYGTYREPPQINDYDYVDLP